MYTKVEQEKKVKKNNYFKNIKENLDYLKVTYDLSFVKYELLASIIGIIFLGIIISLGYKLPFVDPIGKAKGIFLTVQIVTAVLAIMSIGIIARHTKLKDSILRNFLAFSTILLIFILCQGAYLSNIVRDNGEDDFARYYEQYENDENGQNRTKLSLSAAGIKNSTEKEDYIKTSKAAFTNFILRSLVLILLELIILCFSFYIIYKVVRTTEKIAAPNTKITA